MAKKTVFLVASSVVLLVVCAITDSWRSTVHQISIPGHPDRFVSFIRTRDWAGNRGYIVHFSNGAETKEAFVSEDVTVEEVRKQSRIEYDNDTLFVFGPRGERMEIPGYIP